jgi:hypothetical protein
MNRYGILRTDESRAKNGLTLRLNIDSLTILDEIKSKTGYTKGNIVNEAIQLYWKAFCTDNVKKMKSKI